MSDGGLGIGKPHDAITQAGVALTGLGLSASRAANTIFMFAGIVNSGQEKWKSEILEQWQATFKMPRKKKKQVRKELNLDWSIACYDPFSMGD